MIPKAPSPHRLPPISDRPTGLFLEHPGHGPVSHESPPWEGRRRVGEGEGLRLKGWGNGGGFPTHPLSCRDVGFVNSWSGKVT